MIASDRRAGLTRWIWFAAPLLAAIALGALLWTRFGDAAGDWGNGSSVTGATRTSEGGQVTIAATWQGPNAGPVFRVVLDTHTVNLDGYDLIQLAVLRTAEGREVPPSGWDAPQGGHHREGTLIFPSTAPDGSPTIGSPTGAFELVIRDVAGVPERTFRWTP